MDEKIDSKEIGEGRKGGINPKVFIIGLPLFILQLVVVYFITGNFLLGRMEKKYAANAALEEETEQVSHKADKKKKKKKNEEASGNFFFTVNDIIINPAGTNGSKYLMASVGFAVQTEEEVKVLKEKEVLVRDVVISTLSSKTVAELGQTGYKDSLKAEFSEKLSERIPDIEVSDILFGKYIFQ